MAEHTVEVVWRVAQRAVNEGQSTATDHDLLRRFTDANDQSAFAALFDRHARMVLGVCRRALPGSHDAEDACQATFFLLARKAASGRWHPSVANWLYTTARKVSANARAASARRMRREAQAASTETILPIDQMTARELLAILDEELAMLPSRYREPLVLCYLEGLSRGEAARRLGLRAGTLKIRLERGRKRLADALAARGCVPGVGLLALATTTAEATPSSLRDAVLAATSGPPPAPVAALASGVALVRAKAQALLASLVAVTAALGVSLGLANNPTSETQPPVTATNPPPPTVATPNRRTDAFGDPLPPGAVARLGTTRFQVGMWPEYMAASPDGSKLVTLGNNLSFRGWLSIWDLASGRRLRETELPPGVWLQGVCWTRGGRGFAVIKVDATECVMWDFTDEKAIPPQLVPGARVNSVGIGVTASAVSPDAKLVAVGRVAGADGTGGQLELRQLVPNTRLGEMESLFSVGKPGRFTSLLFTPTGDRLVGISQSAEAAQPGVAGPGMPVPVVAGAAANVVNVFVWDVNTKKEILAFEAPGRNNRQFAMVSDSVYCITSDGRTLYAGSKTGRVSAIDLSTGKERLTFDTLSPADRSEAKVEPFLTHLAISADDRTLLSLHQYIGITGFDAQTGKERWRTHTIKNPTSIMSFAILPDGKRFVMGGNEGTIQIRDTATGQLVETNPVPQSWSSTVSVAQSGQTAVTCGTDGTIRHWDLISGKEQKRTQMMDSHFRASGISPDQKSILEIKWTDDKTSIIILDMISGKVSRPLPVSGMGLATASIQGGRPIAWMPDGSVVLADGSSNAFRIDQNGKELQRFSALAGESVKTVAAAPDGRTVVLAGERPRDGIQPPKNWLAVYDVSNGWEVRRWESSTRFVNAAFTPDGSAVILTGNVSPPPWPVGEAPPKIDLSAAVVLFDPASGQGFTPFAAPEGVEAFGSRSTTSLVIAPTGYQFAVAEWDNSLTVYETASGAIRRRLRGHRNAIQQLAFTSDGSRLVSVSADGTGLVWDLGPPQPVIPVGGSDADRLKRWNALASPDGAIAHRAMGELAADPVVAVAVVKANLKPTPAVTDAEFDQLIARLGAEVFADREKAGRDLDKMGRAAVSRAREALPKVTSAEARQRLGDFLTRHDRPDRLTGADLQNQRAVELLETIATPDARALLRTLAAGGQTPLTQAAAAAAIKRFGVK